MTKAKFANSTKVVGVLTFISALVNELMPLIQKENPKLKKKVAHIISLVTELKDEIMEVAVEFKKKKK